jgi:hypothetical protein
MVSAGNRDLTMMNATRFGRLLSGLLLVSVSFVGPSDASDQNQVSSLRIAQAIRRAGVTVEPDQIQLLFRAQPMAPDAKLEVVHIVKLRADVMRAEMRCRDRRECMPFYVLLHDTPAERSEETASNRFATDFAQASAVKIKERLIRTGDPATLILEDRNMRITLRVICLENGARGERVRVSSTDHKRIYQAEVIDPGLLKSAL